MDLVLMESLLAVEEAGTITEAADRIHVSQSALSRRLQQLESELGATLLVRGKHGVELTEVGRTVVEHGRTIVGRYARLRREVGQQLGLEQGSVRLGGGATVVSYVLLPAMAAFAREHPGIRFYVKEAGSNEIAADVAAGDVEVGVATLPVTRRDVDVEPLVADDVVLVAANGHRLAGRTVAARDLEGETFIAFESGSAIRQIIDSRLRAAGVDAEISMELRSIPSMLKMVAATGNLAFVSRLSLAEEPGLGVVNVRGLRISRQLGVVTRRGIPLAAPAQAFVDRLRSEC